MASPQSPLLRGSEAPLRFSSAPLQVTQPRRPPHSSFARTTTADFEVTQDRQRFRCQAPIGRLGKKGTPIGGEPNCNRRRENDLQRGVGDFQGAPERRDINLKPRSKNYREDRIVAL